MRNEIKYLIETEYVDDKKMKTDFEKGTKVILELREKLLPEFSKIRYFENQFDFWEEKLGINYFYYFLEYVPEKLQLINLSDFKLTANSDEWKTLNEWLLKMTPAYIERRAKENREVEFGEYKQRRLEEKFISFEKLKSDYEISFSADDEISYVKNEKKNFDDKIANYFSSPFQKKYSNVYDDYLSYKITPDWSKICPDINTVLETNNAFQYALFSEFIEIELRRVLKKENPKLATSSESPSFSSAQVILLSYYVGLLHSLNSVNEDKTVKARIISAITGLGYHGLYENIKNIESLKNEKNLVAVIKRLKEKGLQKFIPVIEEDLKRVKK